MGSPAGPVLQTLVFPRERFVVPQRTYAIRRRFVTARVRTVRRTPSWEMVRTAMTAMRAMSERHASRVFARAAVHRIARARVINVTQLHVILRERRATVTR